MIEPSDGSVVTVTGWGLSNNQPAASPSETLQTISLQTINYAICLKDLALAQVKTMSLTEMCTSNGTGKGDCNGDRLVKTLIIASIFWKLHLILVTTCIAVVQLFIKESKLVLFPSEGICVRI